METSKPKAKARLRKGLWSPEEDEKLIEYVTKHGHKCWSIVPKQAGLQRCGKSCRLRWINYLRPDVKRGEFSKEEQDLIIKLHEELGNRWAQIATYLPGRTDNDVKNYWNSCLRRKLKHIEMRNLHLPLSLKFPTSLPSFSISSSVSHSFSSSTSQQNKDATLFPSSDSSKLYQQLQHCGQDQQQLEQHASYEGCGIQPMKLQLLNESSNSEYSCSGLSGDTLKFEDHKENVEQILDLLPQPKSTNIYSDLFHENIAEFFPWD